MSSWTKAAKKIAAGKWVRFDAATPALTITFIGEPKEVEKVSQQGPTKGEHYTQMSFPVLVDGDERILEPNKSLLTQLIEEDEEEPIIGAELYIKCLNPEKKTQWKIKRIKTGIDNTEQWKKQKPAEQEEDETEEQLDEKLSRDTKDKDKFMEGMKKHKEKKAKKEEKPTVQERSEIDN